MVSPELIMVSPELIGMVSPELKWAILGAPYERLRSDIALQGRSLSPNGASECRLNKYQGPA